MKQTSKLQELTSPAATVISPPLNAAAAADVHSTDGAAAGAKKATAASRSKVELKQMSFFAISSLENSCRKKIVNEKRWQITFLYCKTPLFRLG
jgi:hypothetical protein